MILMRDIDVWTEIDTMLNNLQSTRLLFNCHEINWDVYHANCYFESSGLLLASNT